MNAAAQHLLYPDELSYVDHDTVCIISKHFHNSITNPAASDFEM